MKKFLLILAIAVLLPLRFFAQAGDGSAVVTVSGDEIESTSEPKFKPLSHKRFYVFKGGIEDNAALVTRIKESAFVSRDCYYAGLKPAASGCFIKWLQKTGCLSPLCLRLGRPNSIDGEPFESVFAGGDIENVKEFGDALNKGKAFDEALFKKYKKRPDLALSWIVNNLPRELVYGFSDLQTAKAKEMMGDLKPLAQGMTGEDAKAMIVDIPVGGDAGAFLVSNLVPVEVDGKAYVFVWEISLSKTARRAAVGLTLAPEDEETQLLVTKEITACEIGACDKE
jgi:hypothetical protein